MDFIISLHSTQSKFTPEKNIRLTGVSKDYALGYKTAIEKQKTNYNVYLEELR